MGYFLIVGSKMTTISDATDEQLQAALDDPNVVEAIKEAVRLEQEKRK